MIPIIAANRKSRVSTTEPRRVLDVREDAASMAKYDEGAVV